MAKPRYPSLYQINTRVWLTELSAQWGRPATLDDIPDRELDRLATLGFDWVWLLSVWQTGEAGQRVSRSHEEWRREFQQTLPDLRDDDIAGSGFAITDYVAHPRLGGEAALARLRTRLRQRGLRLMLDFVPNHMGLDHPWVEQRPDLFVSGTEADLARAPHNYTRVGQGACILAHGRDPFFPGWPDTLQLNYGNTATQEAMTGELCRIAEQCDGVRCDMAMLVLPEVFERTWGIRSEPFWPKATRAVRERFPEFCFLAEVYWDLEWALLQQGFDYTYDKRLYDRLRDHHPRSVREHLWAELDYQSRMARFLENHDEPRAATTFPASARAAAIVTFLSPGLRFFHHGQFEGKKQRISPHLVRGPDEPVDRELEQFYERLLAVLRERAPRHGHWQLLECRSAWDGNTSHDRFVAYGWHDAEGQRLLVTVNYAPHHSQCYVGVPFGDLASGSWRLRDLLGGSVYERAGEDLAGRGLYLDVPPWHGHVFAVTRT